MSDDATMKPPELVDRLDALNALLEDLIGALGDVASAQQVLHRHADLIAERRQAAGDVATATLH